MLRRARRQNPDSLVAAIGCYPSVSPEDLHAMHEVDLVVGSIEKLTVVDEILAHVDWTHETFDEVESIEQVETRTRRMIKIQEGCRAHCTYCVIPRARGAPRSIAPAEVVAEVQRAVDDGLPRGRSHRDARRHVQVAQRRQRTLRLADLLERVLDETEYRAFASNVGRAA